MAKSATEQLTRAAGEWRLPSTYKETIYQRYSGALYPMFAVLLAVLAWEGLARGLSIPKYLLPPPSQVVVVIFERAALLWSHALTTGLEIALGYLLSVAVGIPLAVVIAYSRVFERSVYPLLVASQAIPKVAIAPLFIVWLGFGLMPKVVIAFLIAFFPIIVDTVVGLRSTPPEMFYLAKSMGASRLRTFLRISLPSAAPNIFAGLKVAITLAVVGAIVGEFVAADRGLGYLLLVANGQLATDALMAGIVVLSLIGILMFYIVEFVEKLVIPWHQSQRVEQARPTA